MADLSPLAIETKEGLANALGASFGEPVLGYDNRSSRDEQIKEWGICVGVAYAVIASQKPFADSESLENLTHEIAREVFYEGYPECQQKEEAA